MTLHVLYRSYGGENRKDRPPYYGKLVCLLSLLRAAERVDAELVFVNNGPAYAEVLPLMHRTGRIVELPGLRMPRSYLAALHQAVDSDWPDDDIVWFSEDDYLYEPDALVRLLEAVAAHPEVDCFGLYAGTPEHQLEREPLPGDGDPRGWRQPPPVDVGDQRWVRVRNTTASFAVRLGALRADVGIHRLCTYPHRNMFRDQDIAKVVQGFQPYRYRALLADAALRSGGTPKERLREAFMVPFRVVTNLRAHRRPERRRLLLAPAPNLATHVEQGYVAPGRDWAALAEETWAWGREQGLVPGSAAV